MDDPIFLSLDETVRIQQDQLIRYGGCEGIGDVGLLQSALAMPQSGCADRYVHEDEFKALVWAMARGEVGNAEAAPFFRRHKQPEGPVTEA